MKRRKTHFHQLPCGASIILGNNGFIWISPTRGEDAEGGFTQNLEVVPETERETISRYLISFFTDLMFILRHYDIKDASQHLIKSKTLVNQC